MELRGRESAILNPTTQTLDHHHLHRELGVQEEEETEILERDPNPNQDPAELTSASIAGISNSNTPLPPPPPQPQPTTASTNSSVSIQYRECLRNHAASVGGNVLDGCGEFMPSGEEGTPEALKCAACECHRNFHRKEIEGELQSVANCYYANPPDRRSSRNRVNDGVIYRVNDGMVQRTTIHPTQPPPSLHTPPPPQHQQQHQQKYHHGYSHGLTAIPSRGPMPQMMAFGGDPTESSSEDLNMFGSNTGALLATTQPSFSMSKKRFRTKFSREQKDRMHEFAEKLGWKIQKQDEQEVQQFCNEVGVKRQVFKVWMHNNKQAMKKKQL